MPEFRKLEIDQVVRVKISGMGSDIWMERNIKDHEVFLETEEGTLELLLRPIRRLIAAFHRAIKKQPKKRGNK